MDDFALIGLAGDDGEFARLAFAVGRFREVEAELGFTRMVIHPVAGETMLREDRADFLVEVDGGDLGKGAGEQGGEGKAEHGAGVRAGFRC